jgi:hypothetical protein
LKKNEKWGEIIIQMVFEKICSFENKSNVVFKDLENENHILRNALQVIYKYIYIYIHTYIYMNIHILVHKAH